MPNAVNHLYEFGPYRLDPEARLLLRGEEPVTLSPKAAETLLVLVMSGGRVVSREELIGQVWPDTFVEENNLSVHVSALRRALGVTPEGRPYIETLPRRGYRFTAGVREVCVEPAALILEKHTLSRTVIEEEIQPFVTEIAASDPSPSRQVRGGRPGLLISRKLALAAAAVTVMIVSGAGFFRTLREPTRAGVTTSRIKSVAVLPFKVVNGDEHIGLGIADVLITRLSNIRELNVRPTSAVMDFGGQDSAIAGRRLNVDAVLEGTVYRAAGRLRVTARLLKVSDQKPVWAGQFEESARDELKVQDEISLRVADALALSLSDREKEALTKRHTESADAYQLYLKGRYHWNRRNNEGMAEAERLFRNAIEKDPNFAPAYVGVVDKLAMQHPLMSDDVTDERIRFLKKALELDPDLAEAHATLGFVRMFHFWQWREAEAAFRRAIELNPGYATTHHWYATLLGIVGRTDQAKAEMRRALEINPLSHNFLTDLGEAHYFAREYDRAEEYCHRALEIYPDFTFAHGLLSNIYLQRGEYEKFFEVSSKPPYAYLPLPDLTSEEKAKLDERSAEAREIFKRGGLKAYLTETLLRGPVWDPFLYYKRAQAYALLGEKEEALGHLEAAYRHRVFLLAFVKADPFFDGLRPEPRYQALLRRMGLDEL